MEGVAREIRLVARPQGFPDEDLFEVAETSIPDPADGQVLIRNAYFSVDPYMRPRMNDVRSYVAPFTLGEAMTGGAVGRVVASRNSRYAEGDWVLHQLGWREWALSDGSAPAEARSVGRAGLDRARRARDAGLHRVVRALRARRSRQEGETVFVSGAAGAVGSAAGQMAKIAGCRVIGSAGSAEKLEWLRELGFDDVFDYREQSRAGRARRARARRHRHLLRQRRRRSPRGGDRRAANARAHRRVRLDLALQRRRADAGTAEHVPGRDEAPPHPGVHHQRPLRPLRRVRTRRRPSGCATAGFATARRSSRASRTRRSAFLGLLRGENIGKMLVKVGPAE